MKPLEGNDFTMPELREALRKKGLPTKGTKAELIQWLVEQDPNIWTILGESLNKVPGEEGTSAAAVQETWHEPNNEEDAMSVSGEGLRDAPAEPNFLRRELELIRRERELIERERGGGEGGREGEREGEREERELLRKERKVTRDASTTSSTVSAAGGVRGLKDLLPEFSATENTFWRWKNQLELLRNSYELGQQFD